MSDQCLFCKIIKGDIPSKKIFENEKVFAFIDIHPQASTHLLFVHKNHTSNISEMSKDEHSLGDIFKSVSEFAATYEPLKNGFRIVTNQGQNAGQTVFHTHFHVLGGEPLGRFGSR